MHRLLIIGLAGTGYAKAKAIACSTFRHLCNRFSVVKSACRISLRATLSLLPVSMRVSLL
jgi:hypothetical protein